jgi:two-component system, chemotaxis family, chemotaxis protein CheY
MQSLVPRHLEQKFATISVLIVDDDHYMRKVVRAMLMAIGVKRIHEAGDGMAGLEAIRQNSPDVVLVDWEMPGMDGPQFVAHVRQPGAFPMPDVPIIMLTGHGDRWRVVEAARAGAHEYLLKPVSTKALMDRIVAVLEKPRPIVKTEGYYGPAPRKLVVVSEPEIDRHGDIVLLN